MACNRRISVGSVLVLVITLVTATSSEVSSDEFLKNVSSAAIRFDGIQRQFPKKSNNHEHWRSLEALSEKTNSTDCSGLQVIFIKKIFEFVSFYSISDCG